MSVKIRLTQSGKKNQIQYRLVVQETRTKRDGKFLEILGHFDPKNTKEGVVLNKESYDKWLKLGAKPTPSIAFLLENGKLPKKAKKPKVAEGAPTPAQPKTEDSQPSETPAKEQPTEDTEATKPEQPEEKTESEEKSEQPEASETTAEPEQTAAEPEKAGEEQPAPEKVKEPENETPADDKS